MMRYLLVGIIVLGSIGEPSRAEAERAEPSSDQEAAERQRWTDWKLEALHRQKKDLRVGGPAAGIAFSVLGIAAGSWMLSLGVGSPRVSDGNCEPGSEQWLLGGLCYSGSAPYAGTVLIGISVLGVARAGKKLKRRKRRKRQINASIRELETN